MYIHEEALDSIQIAARISILAFDPNYYGHHIVYDSRGDPAVDCRTCRP